VCSEPEAFSPDAITVLCRALEKARGDTAEGEAIIETSSVEALNRVYTVQVLVYLVVENRILVKLCTHIEVFAVGAKRRFDGD